MNLLNETVRGIGNSGHTVHDIMFIGSEDSGYSCDWDKFATLSNQEYDPSFGASEVAQDLIIVFSDGSKMWRGEYDGSEWWEYSTPFIMPKDLKSISKLFAFEGNQCGWVSLKDLHENQ